jgi:hypothetical protein
MAGSNLYRTWVLLWLQGTGIIQSDTINGADYYKATVRKYGGEKMKK